jgi:hypothetical protein
LIGAQDIRKTLICRHYHWTKHSNILARRSF